MLLSQKNGINRRKNFHPLERVFPMGGSYGGLFSQEGIGKRMELLDGVGLDG